MKLNSLSKSKFTKVYNSVLAWPQGFFYILKNRWIQKYIFIAILLNFLIFLALLPLTLYLSSLVSGLVLAYFSGFAIFPVVTVVLTVVIWLIFIFLISQIFTSISSIVNAPVYSNLTSEMIRREFPEAPVMNSNIVSEISNALSFELKKLFLSFSFLLILFLINFIPFIGSFFYLLIIALQIIFTTSLDVFEPYHSLKKYTFRQRIVEIGREPFANWPFMLIVGILGAIPFLNIFVTPISVVGATKLLKTKDNKLG